MSTSIDQKVVEMRFDNANFEKNVSTSMSTIDKLKAKLNFKDASKSLEDLEKSSGKVNMSGLSNAVETVKVKFSALEVMGVTALANITNSAVNAGKQLVKSLSVDNISAGWKKYEDETTSVGTLISQGYDLETVEKELARLSWFADETSYSLTDMTDSISKFTATGQNLKDSRIAIQGIANWAALSGQNTQKASSAMYQLSQALGAGMIRKEDWKSIQNLNMDTDEFRQKALDAGVALKTLRKNADGTYTSLVNMKEAFTKGQFAEHLTEDAWFTSDVMMKVFQDYSLAVDQIYDYTEEKGIQTSDAIKELAGSVDEFSLKAFKAGQETRTYSNAIDAIKDAVSTGWKDTFKIIFGDYEKATKLWTAFNANLYEIFAEPGYARNDLLKEVLGEQEKIIKSSDWDKFAKETGESYKALEAALINVAKSHNIEIESMIKTQGSFSKTLENGWLNSELLNEALTDFTKTATKSGMSLKEVQKISNQVIQGVFGNGVARYEALTKAGKDYNLIQSYVNHTLLGTEFEMSQLSDVQLKNAGCTEEQIKNLRLLAEEAKRTGTPINELVESLTKPSGRELLFESIQNVLKGLSKVATSVKKAFTNIFPPKSASQLYDIIESFNKLTKKMLISDENAEKLTKTFEGLFAIIDIIYSTAKGLTEVIFTNLNKILGSVNINILDVTNSTGNVIVKFRDWLKSNNFIVEGFKVLVNTITDVIIGIKEFIKSIIQSKEAQNIFNNVVSFFGNSFEFLKEGFGAVSEKVKEFVENIKTIDGLSLDKIWSSLTTFFSNLGSNLKGANTDLNVFKNITEKIGAVVKTTSDSSKKSIDGLVKSIKDGLSSVANFFKDNFSVADLFGVGILGSLVLLGKGIKDLVKFLKQPMTTLDKLGQSAANLMNAFASSIKPSKWKARIDMIYTIAKAILVLALAVGVMALIPSARLWECVGAVAVLAGILVGLTAAMNSLSKLGTGDYRSVVLPILSMAAGLFLVTNALGKIAKIDPDRLVASAAVLVGIIAALTGFAAAVLGASKLVHAADAIDLTALASVIISFSAGIFILVIALKILSNIDYNSVSKMIIILNSIITQMLALAIFSSFGKNLNAAGPGLGLLAMCAGVLVLALAIKKIGKIDILTLIKAGIVISSLFKIFGLIMVLSKFSGTGAKSAGLSILAMSAAILILTYAMDRLAKMSVTDLAKSVTYIGILMVICGLLTQMVKYSGENMMKAGVFLLAFSGAMLILSLAVIVISHLDWNGITKGLIAITVVGGILSGLLAVTKIANTDKTTLPGLIALIVGIVALTAAMIILASMDQQAIMNASLSITLVMGAMAVVIASTKLISKDIGETVLILGVLTVIVMLIGVTITAIANTANPEAALPIAEAMSLVLIAIAGACAILSLVKDVSISAIATISLLSILVIAIGAVIAYISNTSGADKALSIAEGMSLVLVAMSIVCLALIPIGLAGEAAMFGAVILGAVIAELMLVFLALGELLKIMPPDFETTIQRVIDVLCLIAGGLGEALGSFIGGIGKAITKALVVMGEDLSKFSIAIQPFAENIKKIDSKVLASTAMFALVIAAITAAEVTNSIGAFLSGGSPILKFATQLPILGASIWAYYQTIKDIDSDAVQASASAAKMLAEFANNIPKTGGLVSIFTGDNSMLGFGAQLVAFGALMKAYANEVKDIDTETVTATANAAKTLSEFANNIPNTGGVASWFTGDITLEAFGKDMVKYGKQIIEFNDLFSDVSLNEKKFESAKKAGTKMLELAEKLPKHEGVVSWFEGDNKLDDFGSSIVKFGRSLIKFSNLFNITTLNEDCFDDAKKAGETLLGLADVLQKHGGVVSWFAGDNTLEDFGDDMFKYGSKLIEFSNLFDNVTLNRDALDSSIAIAESMVNVAKVIPINGGIQSVWNGRNTLESFGDQMIKFGKKIIEFNKYISNKSDNIDKKAVENAVDSIISVFKIFPYLDDGTISWDNFKKFADNVSNFGKKSAEGLKALNEINITKSDITTKTDCIKELVGVGKETKLLDDAKIIAFGKSIVSLAKDLLTASKDLKKITISNTKQLINNFASGITADTDSIKKAAEKASIAGANALKTPKNQNEYISAGKLMLQKIAEGLDISKFKDNSVLDICDSIVRTACSILSGGNPNTKDTNMYYSSGRYASQGFINGFSSKLTQAKNAAKKFGEQFHLSFNVSLDEHSPSKKFEESGKFAILGLIRGIDKNLNYALDSATNLGERVISSFQKPISDIANILDSGIDINPTITPVLDLSQIQNGASQLNNMIGGFNGYSMSIANKASQSMNSFGISDTNNVGDLTKAVNRLANNPSKTFENTFNITGNDPTEIANEVSKIIQKQVEGRDAVWA